MKQDRFGHDIIDYERFFIKDIPLSNFWDEIDMLAVTSRMLGGEIESSAMSKNNVIEFDGQGKKRYFINFEFDKGDSLNEKRISFIFVTNTDNKFERLSMSIFAIMGTPFYQTVRKNIGITVTGENEESLRELLIKFKYILANYIK